MQNIIVKRSDPVVSAGLIDHGLSKQAQPPFKTVSPFSQVHLARKPTVPARPLFERKLVHLPDTRR